MIGSERLRSIFDLCRQSQFAIFTFVLGFGLCLFSILTFDALRNELGGVFENLSLNRSIEKSSNEIISDLLDAQTAYRGYLLTSDQSYLASLEAANASVLKQTQALRALVKQPSDLDAVTARYIQLCSIVLARIQSDARLTSSAPVRNRVTSSEAGFDEVRQSHGQIGQIVAAQLVDQRELSRDIIRRLLTTLVALAAGVAIGSISPVSHALRRAAELMRFNTDAQSEIRNLSANLHNSQTSRAELNEQFLLALSLARVEVFSLQANGAVDWVNQPLSDGLLKNVSTPVRLSSLGNAEGPRDIDAIIETSFAAKAAAEFEMRTTSPENKLNWYRISLSPVQRASSGSVFCASIDITALKEREEGNFWLTRELMHRSRNLLSILQSTARHSAKSAHSPREFNARFVDRLHGISMVHDILVSTSYMRASFRDVVRSQIGGNAALADSRIEITGEDFDINPDAAQTFAMGVRELYLNAKQYGALSTPLGRILISWRIDATEQDPKLHFSWRETKPHLAAAPDAPAFGTFMITVNLPRALEGSALLTHSAGGTTCEISVPLRRLRAHDRDPMLRHTISDPSA